MMLSVPIVREIAYENPAIVATRLSSLPHFLFMDSVPSGPGQYSYLSADPRRFVHGHTLDDLKSVTDELQHFPTQRLQQMPPFQGGVAGVINYGFGRAIEPRVENPQNDEFQFPGFSLGIYDWVIAFDHHAQSAYIIANGSDGEACIDQVLSWLESESPETQVLDPRVTIDCHYPLPGAEGVSSNFSKQKYLQVVRRAIEYIHAGDCFQVNIAQRLLAPQTEMPFSHYLQLRQFNPAPYACYFDAGNYQILSASPEQFIGIVPVCEDGPRLIKTRPIKGTRQRSSDPIRDAALIEELQTSEKDRAENVMIVDLLRNDLGRVCKLGEVKVLKLCELQTFEHVHHLVSEVQGILRDDVTAFDILKATFPGGSITGAPKVRAMQIIAELEQTARGPYCGSAVAIGFNGTMQSNILIRTMTAAGGWLQFPVGSGIVADSVPELEYEETLHKAQGMLQVTQGVAP